MPGHVQIEKNYRSRGGYKSGQGICTCYRPWEVAEIYLGGFKAVEKLAWLQALVCLQERCRCGCAEHVWACRVSVP